MSEQAVPNAPLSLPVDIKPAGVGEPVAIPELGRFTALEFLNGYAGVFIVAFLVTLLATPFVRKLAIEMEIIDKPNEARTSIRSPTSADLRCSSASWPRSRTATRSRRVRAARLRRFPCRSS
jgi:hypothetical protein